MDLLKFADVIKTVKVVVSTQSSWFNFETENFERLEKVLFYWRLMN